MNIKDKSPYKLRNIGIAIRAAKGEAKWQLAYEVGIDESRINRIISKYNRLAFQYAVLSSYFPLQECEKLAADNFYGDMPVKILEIYKKVIETNKVNTTDCNNKNSRSK